MLPGGRKTADGLPHADKKVRDMVKWGTEKRDTEEQDKAKLDKGALTD